MDLAQHPHIPWGDRVLHHRGPRLPVRPRRRPVPRVPEQKFPEVVEQVAEGDGEAWRAEERERIRIAAPREWREVRAQRSPVVLALFQPEDVRGIDTYTVFGFPKKPAMFRNANWSGRAIHRVLSSV